MFVVRIDCVVSGWLSMNFLSVLTLPLYLVHPLSFGRSGGSKNVPGKPNHHFLAS